MRMPSLAIAMLGIIAATCPCRAQYVDDPFSDYLQRSDSIFLGAGNAKDVNAAIHAINPRPPYARNTHIHTTGRQAVDSVEQMYRVPDPFARQGAAASGTTSIMGLGQSGSGSATVTSTGTPLQPISSGGY
jgi:hypothetical protein